MEIYFFIFFILILFSVRGINNQLLVLSILFLSIVLGFRNDNVGTDTAGYIEYYHSITSIDSRYMEPGWNGLIVLCKYVGLSAYSFHFIVALITLSIFAFVCTTFHSKGVNGMALFLLYALGFYFHMFNVERQFLALSIVLIGYSNLIRKRIVVFFLFVIIASTFHLSSPYSLIAIPFLKIELSTKRVFLILAISYVVGLAAGQSFLSVFAAKFSADVENFGFRENLYFTLIFCLLTNLFTLWLYARQTDLKNNGWIKINILSVMILNLTSNLVLGPRIVYMFSICSVFAISLYFLYSRKDYMARIVILLFAILNFARCLMPEILNYGLDGSLVPYDCNFVFTE